MATCSPLLVCDSVVVSHFPDFEPYSPNYGQVLHYAAIQEGPRTSAFKNEAHHMGISNNKKWIATGGIAAFLQGKDEIFVYEVDPVTRFPTFRYSLDLPGACADEFVPLGDSEFLVTMMCNDEAKSPGTVAWFNAETREVKEWMKAPTIKDFNPHGNQTLILI